MTEQATTGQRNGKSLANLAANECRWPIGDPQAAEFHFCGGRKQQGQPYCEEHTARATTPSRPRKLTYPRGIT
jgi:GcrA cell cycle regulator